LGPDANRRAVSPRTKFEIARPGAPATSIVRPRLGSIRAGRLPAATFSPPDFPDLAPLIQVNGISWIPCLPAPSSPGKQVDELLTIDVEETFWSSRRSARVWLASIGLNRSEGPGFGSKQQDLENIVTGNIDIRYLEKRYSALENEISNARLRSPADDLRVADLRYRKLIIADEIEQHRRTVQRFDLAG
jgi:hypothetical protein